VIAWWRPWDPKGKHGNDYPLELDPDTEVMIQMRDGDHSAVWAPAFSWRWDEDQEFPESDIVKYATRKLYKKCN
jgi:hypothetical protein